MSSPLQRAIAAWLPLLALVCCSAETNELGKTEPPDEARCQNVAFASPELEAEVWRHLALLHSDESYLDRSGPVPAEEALKLEGLRSSNAAITSLAGLECLTSLTALQLDGSQVNDLTPLASLPLEYLILDRSFVSDLTPVAKLVRLSQIRISNAEVTDLSAISDLPELLLLNFAGNPIADTSKLEQRILPSELGCDYRAAFQDTPLTADRIAPLCQAGWYVEWGSAGSVPNPPSSCNRERLVANDCIPNAL